MTFTGRPAASVLQADPEKTCSIEFFSMSKSYNMGGFRIGFAIGNADIIQALRQVKANVDFNQYRGIQQGAIAALRGPQDYVQQTIINFQQRRDAMVQAMENIGWSVAVPEATMYLWAKLPEPYQDSIEFCVNLVKETGVAIAPGRGFGKSGEGYVRIALVHPPARLEAAMDRVAEFLNGNRA
jgi:aspartate/methionine/tyrosine aminotransferase